MKAYTSTDDGLVKLSVELFDLIKESGNQELIARAIAAAQKNYVNMNDPYGALRMSLDMKKRTG